jgi:hypothetical protein
MIVLEGRSTSIDNLVLLIPDVLTAVTVLQRGKVLRIGSR